MDDWLFSSVRPSHHDHHQHNKVCMFLSLLLFWSFSLLNYLLDLLFGLFLLIVLLALIRMERGGWVLVRMELNTYTGKGRMDNQGTGSIKLSNNSFNRLIDGFNRYYIHFIQSICLSVPSCINPMCTQLDSENAMHPTRTYIHTVPGEPRWHPRYKMQHPGGVLLRMVP